MFYDMAMDPYRSIKFVVCKHYWSQKGSPHQETNLTLMRDIGMSCQVTVHVS